MEIILKSIPIQKQRFKALGDWLVYGKGNFLILVAKCKIDYEFLMALHELIECFLCQKRGISEIEVNKFDELFSKECKKGLHKNQPEAGRDKRAPYHKEHLFAIKIEKLIAKELKVDWKKYDKEVGELEDKFI